jgi:hypothetical protein
LDFAFAACERVRPWAAEANVCSAIPVDCIVATPSKNAVIAAKPIDAVAVRPSQDKVITRGAGNGSSSAYDVREIQALAGAGFDTVGSSKVGLCPYVGGRYRNPCCEGCEHTDQNECDQANANQLNRCREFQYLTSLRTSFDALRRVPGRPYMYCFHIFVVPFLSVACHRGRNRVGFHSNILNLDKSVGCWQVVIAW